MVGSLKSVEMKGYEPPSAEKRSPTTLIALLVINVDLI
jgi:hypothetical protein